MARVHQVTGSDGRQVFGSLGEIRHTQSIGDLAGSNYKTGQWSREVQIKEMLEMTNRGQSGSRFDLLVFNLKSEGVGPSSICQFAGKNARKLLIDGTVWTERNGTIYKKKATESEIEAAKEAA